MIFDIYKSDISENYSASIEKIVEMAIIKINFHNSTFKWDMRENRATRVRTIITIITSITIIVDSVGGHTLHTRIVENKQ